MATEEKSDAIYISGKAITVIIILFLLLLGTFATFALKSSSRDDNAGSTTNIQTDSSDIPEKCRLPAGQDINAWKEHLSHHTETRDCLKYFN